MHLFKKLTSSTTKKNLLYNHKWEESKLKNQKDPGHKGVCWLQMGLSNEQILQKAIFLIKNW